jgi:2-polyprenyl-3-methyl-5-hydroxy-6-metoxy-1,4-benzoquinol methylase
MSAVILADKAGYEVHYKNAPTEYMGDAAYEKKHLQTFCEGGLNPRGYARGLAVKMLMAVANPGDSIVDAGCGVGNLSVYLANKGFNVTGVEISEAGCRVARQRAKGTTAKFLAESLEDTSLPDASIDHVIGLGTLHHFIKYNVPPEFKRILKPGGHAFFADGFGENKLLHLFHDKEKMARLGDVNLTQKMIYDYFKDFDVEIIATDWFSMLDKLYAKLLPAKLVRMIAKGHFWLDRNLSLPTALSGVVVTHIKMR